MSVAASKPVVILTAIGCLLALMAGTSWLAQAKRAPAGDKAAATAATAPTACKGDTDCVLVPADCCGCNEGGSQRAISRQGKEAYEKQRAKRCAGTLCSQMMSQHPSCSARASCRADTCVLAPAG